MAFRITPNVEVQRDGDRVQALSHLSEPYLAPDGLDSNPRSLATTYLGDVADLYGIDPEWLKTVDREPSEWPDRDAETGLRFAEQKVLLGTTTVSFAQTLLGLPIWEAGFSVVVHDQPIRVTSSHSTLRDMPSGRTPRC